jgi:hypothetical protein
MISRLPENQDDLSDIVIPQLDGEAEGADEPELPEPDSDTETNGKGADEEALADEDAEEFPSFGSRRDETKKKPSFN